MSNDKDTKAVTEDQFADYFPGDKARVRYWFRQVIAPMQQELEQLKEDRDNWKSEAYEEQNRAAKNHQRVAKLQAELENTKQENEKNIKHWHDDVHNLEEVIKSNDVEISALKQRHWDAIEIEDKLKERVAVLESLLREIELLCISSNTDHDIIKKINVITSALSGTEEKQKPDA